MTLPVLEPDYYGMLSSGAERVWDLTKVSVVDSDDRRSLLCRAEGHLSDDLHVRIGTFVHVVEYVAEEAYYGLLFGPISDWTEDLCDAAVRIVDDITLKFTVIR